VDREEITSAIAGRLSTRGSQINSTFRRGFRAAQRFQRCDISLGLRSGLLASEEAQPRAAALFQDLPPEVARLSPRDPEQVGGAAGILEKAAARGWASSEAKAPTSNQD